MGAPASPRQKRRGPLWGPRQFFTKTLSEIRKQYRLERRRAALVLFRSGGRCSCLVVVRHFGGDGRRDQFRFEAAFLGRQLVDDDLRGAVFLDDTMVRVGTAIFGGR